MTKKFSQARRDAFLAALAATGNQTLAAERAKVSRSWVTASRARDAGFDAAVRGAVEEAAVDLRSTSSRDDASAAPQGSRASAMKPPSGWGHLDGAELVVRGTGGSVLGPTPGGGRRVQIARARVRQWSPRAEERFLAALSATCNVKAACAEVGLTAASAYNHRHRWPAFARRWDAAVELGYVTLECALISAACNLFSGEGLADGAGEGGAAPPEVTGITADHALRLLHMHKHAVRGLGKRPGLHAREPDIEDVRAEVLRRLEAMDRHAALAGEGPVFPVALAAG